MKTVSLLFAFLFMYATVAFSQQPTVSSVSPMLGYPGASVTITGTNFNATPSNNIVFFGATRATVTAASTTSLTVTIPTGATYKEVSVNNVASGLTGYSQYPFLPTWDNTIYEDGTINFGSNVNFGGVTQPDKVVIRDLDGDGKPDMIAFGSIGTNGISLYRNVSSSGNINSGSFVMAARVYLHTTYSGDIQVADIDGDGKPDIVASGYDPGSSGGDKELVVFRNTSVPGTISSASFALPVTIDTVQTSYIGIEDIDEDGKPDIVVHGGIYRNQSTTGTVTESSFAARVPISGNFGQIRFSDIDGDGKKDMICGGQVYRNTATAGSITTSSFSAPLFLLSSLVVETGDIDGDGKPDIVAVTNGTSVVSVFRNIAVSGSINSGSFAAPVPLSTVNSPTMIALADLDGDNKIDITISRSASNAVSVFRNISSPGSLTTSSFAPPTHWAAGMDPINIAIGDLDGDYKPELAIAAYTSNAISVLRNNPLCASPISGITTTCIGSSTTLADAAPAGTWSSSNSTVASVSESGVVTGASAGSAVITYNPGAGCVAVTTITVVATLPPVSGSSEACIGTSITLSGILGGHWSSSNTAVATIDATTGVVSPVSVGLSVITFSVGAGCFSTKAISINNSVSPPIVGTVSPLIDAPLSSVTISGANFNEVITKNVVYFGATRANIAAASGTSLTATVPFGATYMPVSVDNLQCGLTGFSGASFLPTFNSVGYYSDTVTMAAPVHFNDGIKINDGLGFGDIDGDGKADLIGVGSYENSLYVKRNISTAGVISSASLAPAVAFGTGDRPSRSSLADIDGDGKLDVIVTNFSNSSISVLRNTAVAGVINSSSFAGKVDIPLGNNPRHVTVADIDADGRIDIVVQTADSISIIRNLSSIGRIDEESFAPRVTLSIGANINGIVAGDVDGDGRVDIGVINGINKLSVFRNSGLTGTISTTSFNAKVDFTTNNGPHGIALKDIDIDGKPDFVVSGSNTNTVSIFRNVSVSGSINSSSLSTKVDFTTGDSPGNIGIGDINGDGRPDIITANYSEKLSVLRNTGTPGSGITASSFATKKDYDLPCCNNTYNILVGDVDGDSRPDLVTSNGGGTDFSIFRNNIFELTPILGALSLCVGNVSNLSNSTSGGTWSSSNIAIATVGPTTGVVNGITAGTATISYSLAGLSATRVVTVYALPAVITGTTNVCVGATTSLSSSTGGGTWACSNTSVATVGPSGIVTGVAASTATISYSLPTGCIRTSLVTVNSLPATVTGTTALCAGATTSLSSTTGGGTWVSSNNGVATVGSGTGIVNAVVAGTAAISYSLPTGCIRTSLVTVNPLPSTITGTTTICAGATTTLSSTPGGGIWASSNTAVATVGTSGIVTGVAAGGSTISYSLLTGCMRTSLVTVNSLPATITGATTLCAGAATSLSSTTGGGTWVSSNTGVAMVGSGTGIVNGVVAGTAAISYSLPTGCIETSLVTVNPLPSTITGTTTICAGATTTLSSTPSGGTWVSSNTGVATVGSGTGIVNGVDAGTATISYSLPSGCIRTSLVTVNPLPAIITGTVTICAGAITTLCSTTPGGTWSSSNTSIATVGSATGIVNGLATGTATISYTVAGGSLTVIVSVSALPDAGLISGAFTVCQGATTLLSSTVDGGVWTSEIEFVATIDSVGLVTAVGTGYNVISYTITNGCGAATATVWITVDPLPSPDYIYGTSGNTVCVGAVTNVVASYDASGAWTSSVPGVASIDETGLITGLSSGSAVISYGLTNTCGTTYSTLDFYVDTFTALPPITGSLSVCVGGSITLSNAQAGGSWTSTNNAIASIGSTGIVYGAANGTAIITYGKYNVCVPGYQYSTATIAVLPYVGPITGLSATVCTGQTITFANTINGGTWSSTNASVASIDSNGVVTGVSAGTTIISYRHSSICGTSTASKTVTVNTSSEIVLGSMPVVMSGDTSAVFNSVRHLALTIRSRGMLWRNKRVL